MFGLLFRSGGKPRWEEVPGWLSCGPTCTAATVLSGTTRQVQTKRAGMKPKEGAMEGVRVP